MAKILLTVAILILGISLGWLGKSYFEKKLNKKSPISAFKPRTSDKYTFENLARAEIAPAEIKIEGNLFSFEFDPSTSSGQAKKVTGLINIPSGQGPFPIIVMLRGWVDQKTFQTGDGTRRAGEYFAKNGFITLAPDFLGYGGSDKESTDIFESRFQTYTTALTLLESIKEIPLPMWDRKNIFLWGHSNGGQIALAILEITGKAYPTVLWAPVSQGFPQSILSYIEEAEDSGKLLIQKLAEFYDLYDPQLYSISNYFEKISPETRIQIHQGTSDDAIPLAWTNSLRDTLKKQGVKVNYFIYSGADHNLQPAWNTVAARDLKFFKENRKIKSE